MLSQYFGPCNSNYELQEELNRSIFKQAFRNGQKTQIYPRQTSRFSQNSRIHVR